MPKPRSPHPIGKRAFQALGRWTAQRPWIFIGAWLILILAALPGAIKAPSLFYGGSGDIPNGDAARTGSLLRNGFENPYGQLLVLAIQDSDSEDSLPAWMGRLDRSLAALPPVAAVMTPDRVLDPRLSPPAGKGRMILIGLRAGSLHDAEQAIPSVRAAANAVLDSARRTQPGLTWAVTGRSALTYDLNLFNARDVTRAEARVIPLTLLILLIAFGSLAAAGLPVLLGIASTLLSLACLSVLARHWLLSNLVQNVSSMLGLAMGIDYSLLIIHRYRECMARLSASGTDAGPACGQALEETLGTAGAAVFFSGLTVMIGLAGMVFTPLMETRSIAWGGCLVVGLSVAAALTLLPALLRVLGNSLEWPRALSAWLPSQISSAPAWEAWSRGVMRWAPLCALLSAAACLLLSWPARYSKFGFPEAAFIPRELEFSRGLAMLTDMGMQGLVNPIDVILTAERGRPALTRERVPDLLAFSRRIMRDTSVARIFGPVDLADHWPEGKYLQLYDDTALAYARLPALKEFFVSHDGRSLLMQVELKPGLGLEAGKKLAREIPGWMSIPGLRASVGGEAVYYNDFDRAMRASYQPTVAFVLIVTGMALMIFFRSPLVALKAMAMNTLSVLAGYGAVVFVFQLGHGHAWFGSPGATQVVPLLLPIMLFCILFGLSMDYEVFLLSRVREIFLRDGDNAAAVAKGLALTGPIITQAALIMVSVFGAFAFARMVVVQMLGLGLAVAVLVDATVIRIVLAPALMRMAGRWNWWPGALPSRRSRGEVIQPCD